MSSKKTTLQKLQALTAQQNKQKKAIIKEVAKEVHAKSLAKFEKATKPEKSSKYTTEQLEYQKMLSDIPTKTICAPAKEVIRKLVSKITKIEIPPLKGSGTLIPPFTLFMLAEGNGFENIRYNHSEMNISYKVKHPTVKQVEDYLNDYSGVYLEDKIKVLNK